MPGRIITLQRQARELGRLRTGVTETKNGRTFPVRSTTWILTSHQRDYLEAAAEEWGGQVEQWQPQGNGAKAWRVITEAVAIDAILPPGDPLSQSYEMWSKGGCQRRCDGEAEQLSSKACLCRAQFGDDFHLQKPEDACRPHTRLNVVLPGLPDLGVWRMETKGFYAANEIAAAVDLIRHATNGAVAVPVRLRIEPRQRVAQGKTKKYPVIVVEIRGATAGQILAGQPATVALDGGPQRQAIGAGPSPNNNLAADGAPDEVVGARVLAAIDYLNRAKLCKNVQQVQALWKDAARDKVLTDEVKAELEARAAELKPKQRVEVEKPTSAPPATEPPADADDAAVEGEVEPDADALWMQILKAAGDRKWNSDALEERITARFNASSSDINGWQMSTFLDEIKSGAIQ